MSYNPTTTEDRATFDVQSESSVSWGEASLVRFLEDSGLLPAVFQAPSALEKPVSRDEAISGFRDVWEANPALADKVMSSWKETGAIEEFSRLELVKEWVKRVSVERIKPAAGNESRSLCRDGLQGYTAGYRFVLACTKPDETGGSGFPPL